MPTPTVQLVSGTGNTLTPEKIRLVNFPWVYFGGDVDTLTAGATSGDCTYYGLDNTTTDVLRMACYRDISFEPVTNDVEDYCYGKLTRDTVLQGYTLTMTVTEDLADLRYLRYFLRQPTGNYCENTNNNIDVLKIGDYCPERVFPVLFEHHYERCDSGADEYLAILWFEVEMTLGAIAIDPSAGYSAPLTFNVRKSETYGGYGVWVRKDSVDIV